MDLENVWQNSGAEDDMLQRMLSGGDFARPPSRLPLNKLRTSLVTGLLVAVPITLSYVTAFFFIEVWQVRVALSILTIFNLFLMVDTWKLYKKTPSTVSPDNNLKQELTKNYDSFQNWWKLQERMSILVYPVALTAGFILGGMQGSGKPVEFFLYNSRMLTFLGITILVLTPVCYLTARGMFHYLYGRHLKEIKRIIEELDT